MRQLHRATIKAHVKPEDDLQTIKESIKALIPFDMEKEKIELQQQKAEGFNEREIRVLTITITKKSHTNDFLEFLQKKLRKEQKTELLSQAESRLDEEYNFYIRIDKDKWTKDKEIWLTDSGNCYHMKLTLAVYPKKKENALALIEKIFQKDI